MTNIVFKIKLNSELLTKKSWASKMLKNEVITLNKISLMLMIILIKLKNLHHQLKQDTQLSILMLLQCNKQTTQKNV